MAISETVIALITFGLAIITAVFVWVTSRAARSVTTGFADVASRFKLDAPFDRGDSLELTFTTDGKRRSFRINFPESLSRSMSTAVVADAAQKLHRYIVSQQELPETTMRLADYDLPVEEITTKQ